MELKRGGGSLCLLLLSVVLFISSFVSAASPTYLSDCIFGNAALTSRNLLQAKKGCPVNFEYMNYTTFTSQCKGPKYPPALCCGALKQFACPYADYLNDLSNECASIMFSYIYGYGKYPPGLFSSKCRDTKLGLVCPDSESIAKSWVVEKLSPSVVVAIALSLVFCLLVF